MSNRIAHWQLGRLCFVGHRTGILTSFRPRLQRLFVGYPDKNVFGFDPIDADGKHHLAIDDLQIDSGNSRRMSARIAPD
ncbi:MAG: hypothetical protein AAF108_02990 [Planctomycetota bacterium]